MTYEEAKIFIKNFKNYEESFSTETLIECLKSENIDDWTKKHNVDIDYYQGQYDEYPKIQDNHMDYVFKEIRQDGISATACYRTNCYTFLIPCEYQLKEGSFLLKCIHTEIPELNQFNFKCHHFDRLNTLIFLETDVKINGNNISLYIPIDALLKRDVDTIVSTHTEYHTSYYNPNSSGWRHLGEEREEKITEWQNLSLSVIDQPIVKTFFSILKNPNCKNEVTIEDLQILMINGIGAMRENIEKREKKENIIFDIIKSFQNRVKQEYEVFQNNIFSKIKEDVKMSFHYNFKIYTIMNLFLFFCQQEALELWDSLTMITTGRFKITDEELKQFLQVENILEKLYKFEVSYDSECHTDTWNNICFMIEEYIDEHVR